MVAKLRRNLEEDYSVQGLVKPALHPMDDSLSNFFETKAKGELMREQNLNYIPTIVYGQVS
jgi:hypothetical protein